jgi:hypothetical protein
MLNVHSQDQSTQAMTEVALALSMAFFSLLLLALVSIGVPQRGVQAPEFVLTETKEAHVDIKNTDKELADRDIAETQYIFYFASKLYDKNLKEMNISQLNPQQKLVLAMPEDTEVTQALSLQKGFNGFDLSLTIMDGDWLAAFEANESR